MRIIVFSDSHGRTDNVRKIFDRERQFDLVVFTGDVLRDVENLFAPNDDKFISVPGNCDFGSTAPTAVKTQLGGVNIYITHGHREFVKHGLGVLYEAARDSGCSLALYGHTHVPLVSQPGSVTLFNPGALCDGSYGVVDIVDGNCFCFHKKVN